MEAFRLLAMVEPPVINDRDLSFTTTTTDDGIHCRRPFSLVSRVGSVSTVLSSPRLAVA
jgi:hypothetical protein